MARVDITEVAADGILTTTITITGDEKEFLFANLMAERKVIPAKTAVLKNAVIEALKNFVKSADDAVAAPKLEQKKERAAAGESNGKRGRKAKDELPNKKFEKDFDISTADRKTVSGSTTAPAFSGDWK
jgi:hypothetical protein